MKRFTPEQAADLPEDPQPPAPHRWHGGKCPARQLKAIVSN